MPCYHPSKVAVDRKLRTGTRSDLVTVPCGKCLGCRADQSRQWAIRMFHESQTHPYSWFLTLTYEDEYLPPDGSLDFEAPTLFLKRLRKKLGKEKLSYFLCGEYGGRTLRPHYHAVIFGPALWDRDHIDTRNDAPVWTSDTIHSAWKMGLHELTGVTFAGCSYVAGYVAKKVKFAYDPDRYNRVDPETGAIVEVAPEFQRMSRRPALGRRWIQRWWRDVYPRDFVVIEGRETKPPRYYDKWMESDHLRHPCPGGCDAHKAVFEEVRHQRYIDAEEIGDEKLIMKEKIHRARQKLYQSRSKI